jgi:GNAT superfamily N-acetyltransferase
MTEEGVELRDQSTGSGSICRRILDDLPTWFGIGESVEDYVAVADRTPTIIASRRGEDVGILTLLSHNPKSAEIHVMAVLPQHHRRGIGRKMVARAEKCSLAAASNSYRSRL